MAVIVDFTRIRAERGDLESRVARARRARAAQAEAAVQRQAEIRSKARVALVDVLNEPTDPTSVA